MVQPAPGHVYNPKLSPLHACTHSPNLKPSERTHPTPSANYHPIHTWYGTSSPSTTSHVPAHSAQHAQRNHTVRVPGCDKTSSG